MMSSKKIPALPENELKERFMRMRPVMRFTRTEQGLVPSGAGELHFVRVESPQETFTAHPRPGNRANRIRKFKEIVTYHCWASVIPEVKPTCEEVLAQIPSDCLSRVFAFEVETDVHHGHIDGNYMRTTTVLYERFNKNNR